MFYVDGAIRMRLYPDRLDMQGNQIRNIAEPTANNHAASKRYVDTRVADEISASPGVPSGAVMAFDLNSCPSGWSAMSTAQGRFIVGTGGGYSRGNTGGANTVALTVAQMPSHTHSVDPPATNTSVAGNHRHSIINNTNVHAASGVGSGSSWMGTTGSNTGYAGEHTHSVDIPAFNSGSAGSGQAHENRPPYLALLYCRKN